MCGCSELFWDCEIHVHKVRQHNLNIYPKLIYFTFLIVLFQHYATFV